MKLTKPQSGTLAERLVRIDSRMRTDALLVEYRMRKMCGEYVASEDPEQRKLLESEIENYDTQLRFADAKKAFRLLAGVVIRYWRMGEDSVAVAHSMKTKPVHTRQLLFRLGRLWNGSSRMPRKNSHRHGL